ncbi:helix-turn-helix transcriptional regulator [Polaromonas sp.]|uniref:helix-turn-helix transcriptional regulator n=1 Tax=Polaromonas sp. TaxID=1869339 RepID=UPI003BACE534
MKSKTTHIAPDDCVSDLQPQLKMLRRHEVQDVTGLKKSQIYALDKTPGFPQRVKLGKRTVGYIEHEVQAWLKSRVKASRDNTGGAQ